MFAQLCLCKMETQSKFFLLFPQIQVRTIVGDAKLNIAMFQAYPIALCFSQYFSTSTRITRFCTASELQGPRVKVTDRWVSQHVPSCISRGICCALVVTCAQGLAGPTLEGKDKSTGFLFWVSILLWSVWVCWLLLRAGLE